MTVDHYFGKLTEGEWSEILLDGEPLALRVKPFDGERVFVRYFISESPVDSIEDAESRWTLTVLGFVDADSHPICGSEWTGQYSQHDELKVGGHDLLAELRAHEGKYLALEIRKEPV